MKKYLLVLSSVLFFFFSFNKACAQQTVVNGASTSPINFPAGSCVYNWTNNNTSIGLAANGMGNIPSFTAENTGNSPVTATITGTPIGSGFAYIVNAGSGNVSVVNIVTSAVVATITVGANPNSVAVDPNYNEVYIVNNGSATVSVISTLTNTVIKTISVGTTPWSVTVGPDGSKVYVADGDDNEIDVIDATTNTIIDRIPAGVNPNALAVSPDGSLIYVNNHSSVLVINTSTHSVVATIPVGQLPQAILITPDGSKVYEANYSSNNVDVISTATNSVVATIAVGSNPGGGSMSPDGSVVYIANEGSNNVSVISTATNTVIKTIAVGTSPWGVSVRPDGNQIYVGNSGSNTVSVIDAATNAILINIPVGSEPYSFGNFFTAGMNCTELVKYTITVNPTPSLGPTITASTATGTISACIGAASANSNIQQFTVSGFGLKANITATAPAGFEVSLASATGYGNSVTIPQTAGAVSNIVIYVRSVAAASVGSISGNVTLTSAGASNQTVAVTGTINALPTVDAVANQTVNNSAATAAVNFSGTANAYTWVNDTPGTGLAANGSGDISSFTAVNTGNTPVTATITATPAQAPYAYLFNSTDVSVINTLTDTALPGTIPVTHPYGVAITPDGSRVYISSSFEPLISIISTATNKVIGTITIPAARFLENETMSADGSKLYVAALTQNFSVFVIDTKTNTVINEIPVDNPAGLALSPDGGLLWSVNFASGTVTINSTTDNSIVNVITVGVNPQKVVLSPDGKLAYVTVSGSNYVSVINTATYKVIATIPAGPFPFGEVLNADGSRLYVTGGSNSVLVINTLTNAVIATIGVGTNAGAIAISPDGSQIIVCHSDADNISIINPADNTTKTVQVGFVSGSLGNFIANNSGCSGAPIKFTITVNAAIPTITTTVANGAISACTGTISASPQIQQFTVSGIGLTDNITATAPAGFQISLNSGSGYGGSIVLAQTGGVINNTVIYVRSVATATAGPISGNVTLTSAGAGSQTVAVTATINAPLTINGVANQTVNNGIATAPVNFIGTGNAFTWVNDTPGIGLAANGTGDISSFTAVNNGNSPVVATITASSINAGYAYMTNILYNTVSVVNTANNKVVATLPAGISPLGVAISPDGSRVYVTNSSLNNGQNSNTMLEISTATNTVTNTVTVGPAPYSIVLSPDGQFAYIAVSNFNYAYYCNLAVFNTFTNKIVTYIPVGVNPAGVAINPDGSRVYVANSSSETVSVINTATNTVIADIAMDSPVGIVMSPNGKKLYVTNPLDNAISVVDASTNIVTAKITVGSSPGGIAISPDGSKIYVANTASNTVSVINTTTNAVTATIAVDSNPNGICVSPDGSRVYAGSSVINTANNSVIATVPVPNGSIGNFISNPVSCGGSPIKFTITVNPSPPTIIATTATGTISACAGAASASPNIQQFTVSGIGLTGNITATAPPGGGFEISLVSGSGYGSSVVLAQTGGTVSSTVVYVRSAATASTGSISGNVLLTSPGAPTQTVSVTATVSPIAASSLVISASGNNICAGTPVTFTATPTNGGSTPAYQWLLNGSNAGTNSATFSSSTFGNGDVVTCVMTSSSACATPANATSNSVTMNVTANVSPSISIAASQNSVCAGTPVTFTATPINGGSTPVYQWLLNGNNAGTNSAMFSSSNFADGDIVSCVMTSNAVCATPASVTSNSITMGVSAFVSPAISIAASQNNICPGTNVIFTATATNGGNTPVYQWMLNGNNAGVNSPTFASSTLSNGDVISCRVTSNATCLTIPDATSNNIAMTVNALAVPVVSINISANNVCAGTPVTFTATPTNGGSSPVYQWLLNGNNTGANSPTFSSTPANGDVVSCVMTSSAACATPANITSNSIIANIFPLPVVKAGENKTIKKGNSVALTATASANIADITWSPLTGLDNNKILNPKASPESTTLYTITVQTAQGCMATDSVTVNVFDGITIPNTFTPNGDGINDTWNIQNLKDYPNCVVRVYDRWGAAVYSSTGYYNAWDGTLKGQRLPTGTYYYVINLGDGTQQSSGFVALIR